MAGEFDGVGLVASGIDDFEEDFGADGSTDQLSASSGRFAEGELIVDSLNEKASGETGFEGGRVGKDFGDLEQFRLFIDVQGSADAGDFEDHSSAALFAEGLALKNGPADG